MNLDLTQERVARATISANSTPFDVNIHRQLYNSGPVEVVSDNGWNLDEGKKLIEDSHKLGISFIIPSDPAWPTSLNDLDLLDTPSRPVGLWVKGDPALGLISDPKRCISVIGSRNASTTALEQTRTFCTSLASEHGFVIVSGGAIGIDTAAHSAALNVQSPTVVVLPGGLDDLYPRSNQPMFNAIVNSGGALISECPIGTRMSRNHFLARNRIVAALCGKTLLVEATARSGSMNTARWAKSLNRQLLATDRAYNTVYTTGNRSLIDNKLAKPIIAVSDIIEN